VSLALKEAFQIAIQAVAILVLRDTHLSKELMCAIHVLQDSILQLVESARHALQEHSAPRLHLIALHANLVSPVKMAPLNALLMSLFARMLIHSIGTKSSET